MRDHNEAVYGVNEIAKITTKIDHNNRSTLINNTATRKETTNKLIFSTTYSPYIKTKDLKETLLQHWANLENDTTLGKLFPEAPTIAYKRNKNLKDTLIKTKFTGVDNCETNKHNETTDPQYDPNIDILASLLEEQGH